MRKRLYYLIKHRPLLVLFFVFLGTAIIRLPQLTRPLSKHHELNTASVLVCLYVWKQAGVSFSHGAPVQYVPGTYNVFHDSLNRLPHLVNSGAYLSMGSGSYLLPWLVIQVFHTQPSEAVIRLISLLLHFVSALLLFRLLHFLQLKYFPENKIMPLAGSMLFLTLPVVLWFMGNSYSHESMVIPFYLLMLYYGFKIMQQEYRWHPVTYTYYMLAAMAAIYTDWLGAFTAFAFFVQAISIKKIRQRIPFLLVSIVAVAVPVSITLWQYISLIGWQEYKQFFTMQMNYRSLPGVHGYEAIINFIKYFVLGYGSAFIMAIAGIVLLWRRWNRHLTLLTVIPLMHYIVFIGFSGEHDYSVLKWSPLVVVLTIAALYQLPKQRRRWLAASMVISSLLLYELVNPPFAHSFNGERYDWMKNAGTQIKKIARPDEYIFINTPGYFHQLEWYMMRSYKNVPDTMQARFWLENQPGNKAVFFELNSQQQIVNIIRFRK